MSTVTTMKSEEARARFRDILDATVAGNEVVIERYSKPTAVVISYDQWQKFQQRMKRLNELELLLEVRRAKAAVARGEEEMTTHNELMHQIME
ncbi:MAG TPA: type II toxin-antitoxin system prevent-host-death family antitoxin [Caldilineaceae bacterium]|nr:type II toxin-antitoxin system prevent-host-death family antitoxin [Caldilineaceae bacterium]